mmetsp:Transcript_2936/g.7677  ORF Transcript_2936/g.7677 Transcript_2936/m.7677 type:complete len:86 (+) Transcript_2936:698-955(+)
MTIYMFNKPAGGVFWDGPTIEGKRSPKLPVRRIHEKYVPAFAHDGQFDETRNHRDLAKDMQKGCVGDDVHWDAELQFSLSKKSMM